MEIKEAINIMNGKYIRHENKALKDAYLKAVIALEREQPMKPYRVDGTPDDLCMCCGNPVSFIGRKISYCPICGQAILWK